MPRHERTKHSAELTPDLHVHPDFHGNRSSLADPSMKGSIVGLTLSSLLRDLARLYLEEIQAVAHGTRHIVEQMNGNGYAIDAVTVCGGGTRNPVFLRRHADFLGMRLVLPREPEAVLAGAAVLGPVASGYFGSVLDAMTQLNASGHSVRPKGGQSPAIMIASTKCSERCSRTFAPTVG